MILKYSAIHTLILIFLSIILNIINIEGSGSYTIDDFDTTLEKAFFVLGILFIVIPVAINVLTMLFHILSNGKWLWLLATAILAFGATAPYYFIVYRNGKNI